MIKKEYFALFIFLAFSLLFFSFLTSAESETAAESKPSLPSESSQPDIEVESDSAIENGKESDEVLSIGAGITPDSAFYFVEDKILTQFRGDSKNREKKIAEIEEMIKEGNMIAARKALERYERYASELEKEVDPEKSEEAKRSAAAIRNKIKEISSDIPEEAKKDFIEDINKKEDRISIAAELSSKIKDLCEALSKVDPVEYERVCKTNDDAPKWQKNLDKKLTEEQRKEAEKFFSIMSACFKNPDSCKCEDISVTAFAEKCKVVAPLAAKCESGDEKACKEMDEKSEGIDELLPEHLQEVMASVEERYGEAKHGLYMPPECKEAEIKNPRECEKIMIRANAPEECIEASDKGEIKFDNPRQFEKACQEIMFKTNAPEECISAGLKNPKECSKLMFKTNAPEECIEAGLTGESRSDEKKCREIMESKKGERRNPGSGQGFSLGKDCKSIADKDEKLKCFEEMFNNVQQHYGFQGGSSGQFGEKEGQQRGWPEQCQRAQALTKESCEKIMMQESQKRFDDSKKYQEDFARSCSEKGGRWDCGFAGISSESPCRCFIEEFKPPQGFNQPRQPPTEFQCPQGMLKNCEGDKGCYCVPSQQQIPPTQPPPTTMPTTPTTETQIGTQTNTETRTEQQTQTGGTEGSTSTEGTDSTSTGISPTTGSVIGIDNSFLDYYFK